jgi:hypothetical protein
MPTAANCELAGESVKTHAADTKPLRIMMLELGSFIAYAGPSIQCYRVRTSCFWPRGPTILVPCTIPAARAGNPSLGSS